MFCVGKLIEPLDGGTFSDTACNIITRVHIALSQLTLFAYHGSHTVISTFPICNTIAEGYGTTVAGHALPLVI